MRYVLVPEDWTDDRIIARPALDAEEMEALARVICVADGLDPSKPIGTQPLPPREGETKSMTTIVHRQWQMYMPQARAVIAHFGGRIAEGSASV